MTIFYPVGRTEYCKTVGVTRVNNVGEILREHGFTVNVAEVENPDVDIWVYDQSYSLLLVIEVTNWRDGIYMPMRKAISIRNNFRRYACRKLFVCSFQWNYFGKIAYIDIDVNVCVMGFQTQPFYDWYYERGWDDGMRPNTEETKEIVRRNITAYLEEKGLI